MRSSFWSDFSRFLRNRVRKGERYGLGFTLAFLVVLFALIVFLVILNGVLTQNEWYAWDLHAQRVMRNISAPILTERVVFITNLGGNRGTMMGVAVVGLVLFLLHRWWHLIGLVAATALGGVLQALLKWIFRRARPLEQLIPASGYSFPSGHAFAAMVFYGYLIYLVWNSRIPLFWRVPLVLAASGMIALIGWTRVYLNVHYMTDVLAGYVSGLIWLILAVRVFRTVEHRTLARPLPEKNDAGRTG